MTKNKKGGGELSGDDASEWEKLARTVKAYPGKRAGRADPDLPPEEISNIRYLRDIRDLITEDVRPRAPLRPLNIGDLTALDKATAEKFKKGELKIQARLDLHGLRQDEASRTLYQFIRDCYDRQKRCVLVITGKGRSAETKVGVLQQNVPRWLSMPGMRECIVAAAYARPKDGGDGAIYLFIKRIRKQ